MHTTLWRWLIPALLFTCWLGARGLDANPIWNDEWYQIRDARVSNDLYAIVEHLATQNPWHAPGYFIMLNLWARVADWHPFMLRALALFCGLLGVAMTYRLGRDHISSRVGLFAALILATSEFYVHYLHETRMYTWTVFLAALVIWLYLRLVRQSHEPTPHQWLALFLVAAVCLYSHYFLLLPLGAIGLYHLLFAPKNRRWWIVVGVMALAGAAFLPYVVGALLKAVSRASGREVAGLMTGPETLTYLTYLFSNGLPVLVVAFVALALVAVVTWRGRAGRGVVALVFMAFVVAVEILIVGAAVRVFVDERTRYLIFVWALLALVVAVGMVALGRLVRGKAGRALSFVALGVWVFVGVRNNLSPTFTADLPGSTLTYPLHIALRELRDLHRPGDYVVSIVPDDNDYERYNNITPFYVALERLAADSRPIGIVKAGESQAALYDEVMSEIGAGRDYVWVGYRTDSVPSPLSEFTSLLDDTYVVCGQAIEHEAWSLRIDEYARSPVCCTPGSQPRDPFAEYGSVTLYGVDLVPEGNALRVFASWGGGDTLPPDSYSVALHVLNTDGELVAQADGGLPANTFLCPQAIIDMAAVPPGDYRVMLIVYNWRTGERLTGTLNADSSQSDALEVATVHVTDDGALEINRRGGS